MLADGVTAYQYLIFRARINCYWVMETNLLGRQLGLQISQRERIIIWLRFNDRGNGNRIKGLLSFMNTVALTGVAWPPSSGVQELTVVIRGTALSFVILWSRCWQPVPGGKARRCHAAHVAVPLAAPDSLWGDSNTEMLFVDVCTRIDRFNWWSSLASVLLRDIIVNRYITYENVQAWPQLPSNRYNWIDYSLPLSLEQIWHFLSSHIYFLLDKRLVSYNF